MTPLLILSSGYNTDLALRVLHHVIPSPKETKVVLMVRSLLLRYMHSAPDYSPAKTKLTY
jgi:hypothetical protein